MNAISKIGAFLRERQRWVLVALLVFLHLTLLAGAGSTVGRMFWLVDVGLFLLWQPFMQAERRLGLNSVMLIVALIAVGLWSFGWWLLILWVVVLASLLGGRVMMLGHRPTRIFYLLAFAYLLAALLVWLVPKEVPNAALIGPSLDLQFSWIAPFIFVAMLLLPRPQKMRLPGSGMVDFFYSLFVFLLISVMVLGSLAFMLLRQSLYIEAVFKTLVSMASMLLMIAWAWNPRPGFSGIGVFLSRYLLTIGLPFETWLQRMMDCAERESDPDAFLSLALESLLELPWVCGGGWASANGDKSGTFGQESAFHEDFSIQMLEIRLFTQHKLSPALIWHFHLLLQLSGEYYTAKQRQRELQQMSYLRAVHETGARLTHDVKNLLQTLNNLCFMAQTAGHQDGASVNPLLQRQLPQITERLQQTLEKLQDPQGLERATIKRPTVAAETWWSGVQQRHAHDGIEFAPVAFKPGLRLPAALFDTILDNLLHNALIKRQSESGLKVQVSVSPDATWLRVCDNGTPVGADLVHDLLKSPVPSENGLGIGLFHAARQAGSQGHALRLASNMAGEVCFELSRIDLQPEHA